MTRSAGPRSPPVATSVIMPFSMRTAPTISLPSQSNGPWMIKTMLIYSSEPGLLRHCAARRYVDAQCNAVAGAAVDEGFPRDFLPPRRRSIRYAEHRLHRVNVAGQQSIGAELSLIGPPRRQLRREGHVP